MTQLQETLAGALKALEKDPSAAQCIIQLAACLGRVEKRVIELEQQGAKNKIAFSTLETEAETLRSRIKELESHIIDIREEFRNKE